MSIEAGQINLFSKAYENMMNNYVDPGTQFTFKTEKLTYKVHYCNMNYLTKQFASHIFTNFDIHEKNGMMNMEIFSKYLESNKSVSDIFFNAFHENLWGVTGGVPNFLSQI